MKRIIIISLLSCLAIGLIFYIKWPKDQYKLDVSAIPVFHHSEPVSYEPVSPKLTQEERELVNEMFEAIEKIDIQKVKDLLDKGVDADYYSESVIPHARDCGDMLSDRGCDLIIPNSFLRTAYLQLTPAEEIYRKTREKEKAEKWLKVLEARFERYKQNTNIPAEKLSFLENSIKYKKNELEEISQELTKNKARNNDISQIIKLLRSKGAKRVGEGVPFLGAKEYPVCTEELFNAIYYNADLNKVKDLINNGEDINCLVWAKIGVHDFNELDRQKTSGMPLLTFIRSRVYKYHSSEDEQLIRELKAELKQNQAEYEKAKKNKNISAKQLEEILENIEYNKDNLKFHFQELEEGTARNASLNQIMEFLKSKGVREDFYSLNNIAVVAL